MGATKDTLNLTELECLEETTVVMSDSMSELNSQSFYRNFPISVAWY